MQCRFGTTFVFGVAVAVAFFFFFIIIQETISVWKVRKFRCNRKKRKLENETKKMHIFFFCVNLRVCLPDEQYFLLPLA